MINPPTPPELPKPHISDLGMSPQIFSPEAQEPESNFASPILPTPRPSQHGSSFGSMTSLSTHYSRKNVTGVNSSLLKLNSRASSVAGSNLQISHV